MRTISIQLPDDLAQWLESTSVRTGLSQGRIVHEQLEKARGEEERPFMRLAGKVARPVQLSSRKGFSKAVKGNPKR